MKAKLLLLLVIFLMTACTLNESYRESNSNTEISASSCTKIDSAGGNDIYQCEFNAGHICYVADGFEAVSINCIDN